jgi:hypothetical protein
MSTQNQPEKDTKPSNSDQDAAAVKTPSDTKWELTDEEIASVAGGYQTGGSGDKKQVTS